MSKADWGLLVGCLLLYLLLLLGFLRVVLLFAGAVTRALDSL